MSQSNPPRPANPRSPESGELPAWMHRFARVSLGMSLDGTQHATVRLFIEQEIESLTAELSTARERADRAEQERDRWRAWAEHQEWCRPCSEDPEEYRDHECRELKRLAHESPTPTPDHA